MQIEEISAASLCYMLYAKIDFYYHPLLRRRGTTRGNRPLGETAVSNFLFPPPQRLHAHLHLRGLYLISRLRPRQGDIHSRKPASICPAEGGGSIASSVFIYMLRHELIMRTNALSCILQQRVYNYCLCIYICMCMLVYIYNVYIYRFYKKRVSHV